jgi:hypothetical protein
MPVQVISLRTFQREQFAMRVAFGWTQARAYIEAFGKHTQDSATTLASRLAREPEVAARINEIRREHSARCIDAGYLSLDEKRRALAQIFRCDMGALLDDDGCIDISAVKQLPAWCLNELEVNERELPGGVVIRKFKIKLTDKLRALELDNDLAGLKPDGDAEESPEEARKRRARAVAQLHALPGHGAGILPPPPIDV